MKNLLLIIALIGFGYLGMAQDVTTDAASIIGGTTATFNGTGNTLNTNNAYKIRFHWKLSSSGAYNDYVDSDTYSDGAASYSFTFDKTDLTSGTDYDYIAQLWESTNGGISWSDVDLGAEVSFTTLATVAPSVTTGTAGSIATDEVTISDNNVTDEGTSSVTERGVCAGTSPSPTTRQAALSSGGGLFNKQVTGATANTTYYLRAYAESDVGVSYGADIQIKTKPDAPSIVAASDILYTKFTAKWGNTGTGVSYLLDVSTASDFSSYVGSYHDFVVAEGTYQEVITGLTANTQYYYRVRGKNDGGADAPDQTGAYSTNGDAETLTEKIPELTSGAISEFTSGTIFMGTNASKNLITEVDAGAGSLSAKGIEYKIGAGGAVTAVNHSDAVIENWEQSESGLNEGAQYYMRAFATNTVGTGYGAWKSIISQPATCATFDAIDGEVVGDATRLTINWGGTTVGTGDGQLIFVREDGNTIGAPADGSTWTANPNYGSGQVNAQAYCVYYGAGTHGAKGAQSLEITNLDGDNKDYRFDMYEYNEDGGTDVSPNYKSNTVEHVETKDGGSTLPIELIGFDAKKTDQGVAISWTTATEINNDYFEIQRSNNNSDFNLVERVNGAGNSNIKLNYSIFDKEALTGVVFYRLMQVDYDGKTTYSNSISLTPNREGISVENLITDDNKLSFDFINPNNEKVQIKLIDINGRTVKTIDLNNSQSINIDVNNLSSGIYMMTVLSSQRILVKKILL